MKTFSEKTRSMMLVAWNGFCSMQHCFNKATEFHHKLANTKLNQYKYPLFLQSPFNCMPICSDCHQSKPKVRISLNEATAFEVFLEDIKGRAK